MDGRKCISRELKGFDETKGVVEAYANVYNFKDSDGDISVKGCFNDAVSGENRKRIRVFKDHNPYEALGVPLEIDADDELGLRTVTKFNLNKQLSRDMFSDIQLAHETGLNAELSIGFSDVHRDSGDKSRIIKYGWLGEYSFLSNWAANEKSIVTNIKSSKNDIMHMLIKAYGLSYSDARLVAIEKALQALEQPQADIIVQAKNNNIYNLITAAFGGK